MTDKPKICAMESCTCIALDGQYCSDYCRRTAGKEILNCGCGHKDCAGGAEDLESAVG
jgi:hypothetical protein